MVGLLDLSTELLTYIFGCFHELDHRRTKTHHAVLRPILYALSLTCRELSPIAQAALLRYITFNVEDKRDEPSLDHEFTRLQLFVKACEQFPRLVDQIETARIFWERKRPNYTLEGGEILLQERSYLERTIVCLARSSKLRRLQLILDHWSALQTITVGLENRILAFSSIEQLEIGDEDTPDYLVDEEDLVRLCMLQNLTRLQVWRTVAPSSGSQFQSTRNDNLCSNLRTLECWGSWFTPASLRFILSRSPKIRVLVVPTATAGYTRCRLASSSIGTHRTVPDRPSLEPVIDSVLSWVLEPVRPTLEHLFIRDTRAHTGRCHPEQLDLSNFRSLRIAELPGYILGQCIVQNSENIQATCTTLLPPSLEVLNIRFAEDQGLFFTAAEVHAMSCMWEDWEKMWSARATSMPGWLTDLLERSQSSLPNLRKLSVYEEPSSCNTNETVEWLPGYTFPRKQNQGVIDAKFMIRIPTGFSKMYPPFRKKQYLLRRALEGRSV